MSESLKTFLVGTLAICVAMGAAMLAFAFPPHLQVITRKNVGGSCTELSAATEGTSAEDDWWPAHTGTVRYTQRYEADGTGDVCQIDFQGRTTGATVNVSAQIWDSAGGGTQVGGDSDTVAVTGGVYNSNHTVTWSSNKPAIVSGTTYYIAFQGDVSGARITAYTRSGGTIWDGTTECLYDGVSVNDANEDWYFVLYTE